MARKSLSKSSYFAPFKDRAVSSGVLISLRIVQCLKWPYCCLRVFWNRALCVLQLFIREVKHHVYVKQQTQICTTWPSFSFTCRLLFIISTHELVVSRNFLIHKNCFELFLYAHFLFWEILNLHLTFAVYVKALTLYYRSQKTNKIGAPSRPFSLTVSGAVDAPEPMNSSIGSTARKIKRP